MAAQAWIATDGGAAALLDRAGLSTVLAAADPSADILVLVDLASSDPDDPRGRRTVESLIDAVLDRVPAARVRVAASGDSSGLVAGNRDVYALADILGYRYVTDAGHEYDIVDLGEEEQEGCFPLGSALHGTPASAAWAGADVRIIYAEVRTEGSDGFAAALDTLIAALPKGDKDLHYRLRRDPGEVAAALLATQPPDIVLAERHPNRGTAGFMVAGRSPLLVDMAAALKSGLDPLDLPTPARVAALLPPPQGYGFEGDLAPVAEADPPTTPAAAAAGYEPLARLSRDLARPLDTEMFPLLRPLDSQLARLLGRRGSTVGLGPFVDAAVAMAAQAAEAWQTLFAKDRLVRRTVSLDLDPATIPAAAFEAMVEELDALAPIAAAAPERATGLRWRKWDRAVLFAYEQVLSIPFDRFVSAVDVSRAISFMNDYLGGVIVPVTSDDQGRPLRQVERNLYLPQPNYLALYGGRPIDVSKIEFARYDADEHRLYWKTRHSANGSAEADDGIVSFSRVDGGTRVTITGKQRFTLPLVWQMVDLARWPAIEAPLTTMAYVTFFDRTLSNFEALVEGRDVSLGRAADEDTAHPSIALEAGLARLAERAEPLLARFRPGPSPVRDADADGFVHVVPGR